MADSSLAGLVNVLAASGSGVNGVSPTVGNQASLGQLIQQLGGWATQPGVPVQMHGLPASFMDHLNSGGTKTYPSGAFGLGGGAGTPPPNVVNPGLGTGGELRKPGSNPVVPPPFIGGGGELRIPNPAANIGSGGNPNGMTEAEIAAINAAFTSPTQTVTGGTTTAQATGQNVRRTVTLPNGTQQWVNEVVPVDSQWAGYYIPPQYVGHALPGGAFTSLFPNSDGTGWVKMPPPDWGPNWRPTAAARKLGG